MTAGYDFPWAADRFAVPNPTAFPELYEGVLWCCVMAYLLDLLFIGIIAIGVWIVFAVLWLLSFGLLGPLLWFLFGLIPLAYHTLLLSGPRSATFGMRCFDLELRSVTGERPSFLQALIQTALFYITIGMTCSLIYSSRYSTGASAPCTIFSPARSWCGPCRRRNSHYRAG